MGWKKIHEFPNYEINEYGNITSLKKGIILKQFKDKDGYLVVGLRNKKQKQVKVHRLVGILFVKNDAPLIKNQINHLDGDKTNNHKSNLEWCTCKENVNHAIRLGLNKGIPQRPKNDVPVEVFDVKGNFIKKFSSMSEAARELKVHSTNVYAVVRRKFSRKSTGGYVFKEGV